MIRSSSDLQSQNWGSARYRCTSLNIANSDGARRSRCVIEDNAGDKGTESDGEFELLCCLENQSSLTGTSACSVGDRERDLCDCGRVALGRRCVVGIGVHHRRYLADGVDLASVWIRAHNGSGSPEDVEPLCIPKHKSEIRERNIEPPAETMTIGSFSAGSEVLIILQCHPIFAHV